MENNLHDLNDIRRIRNMEKAVKIFEKQLADLKKSTATLSEHREFSFFNYICHEMVAEQRKIAQELLKLRLRLQKFKDERKQQGLLSE